MFHLRRLTVEERRQWALENPLLFCAVFAMGSGLALSLPLTVLFRPTWSFALGTWAISAFAGFIVGLREMRKQRRAATRNGESLRRYRV